MKNRELIKLLQGMDREMEIMVLDGAEIMPLDEVIKAKYDGRDVIGVVVNP